MQKALTIRNYQSKDAPYLVDIIRTTWHYDNFCSPKTAVRMAKIYFFNCLARQTFLRVAEYHGIPVGVIMGRDKMVKPVHSYWIQRTWNSMRMLLSREGRLVGKAFHEIDGVDQSLLKKRGMDYQGELAFFAVHQDCRGTGVGRALFQELLQYMKRQKIHSFYLYTDSSCNYGFYEHQGFIRCGEQKFSVPIGITNEMKFFLYEYVEQRHEGC